MQTSSHKRLTHFKVGDQVMHASYGIGQIAAIEEKRLSGRNSQLFYVVTISKSTVWVPVESDGASSLRLLVSHSALARCRALLKGRPSPLNANKQERFRELSDRLRAGSFEVVCEVVRDLTAHGWPKPLSESEASLLRKAQEAMCREWAAAAGVPTSQAGQEITALLQQGRRTHHA